MAIVKEIANIDDESDIVLNEVGWTSRVYIVNNGEIVVKFLKNLKNQEEFTHEIDILKLIKTRKFNISIPLIATTGSDEILRAKVEIRRQLLPLMEMLFSIERKNKEEIQKCAEKMRVNLRYIEF